MKGFLLGLITASLAWGGYFYWQRTKAAAPESVAKPAETTPAQPSRRGKRRGHGASRLARGQGYGDEPEPVRLSPSDLRPLAQGDDLSTPDVLRLDMSNDTELRELSQDQIDERFRGQEAALLDCISRARPDPETYVPGRVTIKFRIQRAGTVRGVRVEAPAVLQKNGLYACVKGTVGRIRFPAAGTSQIVSYPFTLN
jgi:hypothetical protein